MKLPARAHGPSKSRGDPLLAHKLEDAERLRFMNREDTTISASGRARVAASNAHRAPRAVWLRGIDARYVVAVALFDAVMAFSPEHWPCERLDGGVEGGCSV